MEELITDIRSNFVTFFNFLAFIVIYSSCISQLFFDSFNTDSLNFS
jgi:hypothetical protein